MHELGHALGRDHADESGLMGATLAPGQRYLPDDLADDSPARGPLVGPQVDQALRRLDLVDSEAYELADEFDKGFSSDESAALYGRLLAEALKLKTTAQVQRFMSRQMAILAPDLAMLDMV